MVEMGRIHHGMTSNQASLLRQAQCPCGHSPPRKYQQLRINGVHCNKDAMPDQMTDVNSNVRDNNVRIQSICKRFARKPLEENEHHIALPL